jgi:hypothetical protein
MIASIDRAENEFCGRVDPGPQIFQIFQYNIYLRQLEEFCK